MLSTVQCHGDVHRRNYHVAYTVSFSSFRRSSFAQLSHPSREFPSISREHPVRVSAKKSFLEGRERTRGEQRDNAISEDAGPRSTSYLWNDVSETDVTLFQEIPLSCNASRNRDYFDERNTPRKYSLR